MRLHGKTCRFWAICTSSPHRLRARYTGFMCKLSTKNVDKFWNTACYVENVDKLSTVIVDKSKRGKMAEKTELSTVIVDNSVEKCAHVRAVHF